MKRKIGKVGLSSLVVTLPKSFVDKFLLKKGDEISVVEKNSTLVIQAGEAESSFKETTIDITNFDSTLVWRYMLAAYKKGYDQIKVVFDDKKVKAGGRYKRKKLEHIEVEHLISEISNLLIGMEIISSSDNHYVFKEIAKKTIEEFFPTYRRIVYLLKLILTETKDALITGDMEKLKGLHKNDVYINKLVSYCIRIISNQQNGYQKYLLLINYLEQLGDFVKEIPLIIFDSKKDKEKVIDIIDKISQNLDIINVSHSEIKKQDIILFYNNCEQLNSYVKEHKLDMDHHLLSIKDLFKDIGQILIENDFT